MERRTFLGLAAGAAAWPLWLQVHFALAGDEPQGAAAAAAKAMNDLAARMKRAKAAGKPLLVFVIPGDEKKYEYGGMIGELLNHGGEQPLLDLALCEVVCATAAAVRAAFATQKFAGEPLMLLLETDRTPHPVRTVAPPDVEVSREFDAKKANKAVRKRIDLCAAGLRGMAAPDLVTLARRAQQVRSRLDKAQRGKLDAILAGKAKPDDAFALRCAPVFRYEAARRTFSTGKIDAAIVKTLRKQLVTSPPSGARWAVSTGCGQEIEGAAQNVGVACGMGFVPQLSQRFLYYWTDVPESDGNCPGCGDDPCTCGG